MKTSKKLLSIALILLTVLTAGHSVRAELSPTLQLNGYDNAVPGSVITVIANLSEVPGDVYMLQFAVEYDAEKLQLNSAVAGSIFEEIGAATVNSSISGYVYINWDTVTTPLTNGGDNLLVLFFTPIATETCDTEVRISETEEMLFANWEQEFEITTVPGCVHIIVPQHTHAPVRTAAVAPNCTEPGNLEYWYCEDCGKYFSDADCTQEYEQQANGKYGWYIAPLGHNAVCHELKPATCTEPGNLEYWYCEGCGEYFMNSNFNSTYGPIYGTDKFGWYLQPLGHNIVHHEAKAANCTEPGWAAYDTCSREGCTYTTKVETPALGHDPIQHSGQAATCTQAGWAAYETCSRCDYTTKTEIPALGHDYVQHEGKDATCLEAGWAAYETCSRCDYTTKTEIPALGHDMSVHHEAKAATETEEGWEAYDECSRCGHNNKVIIPMIIPENAIPLTVSSVRAVKGKPVTVYVSVPENTPLYCINMTVQYDTDRLTLDSIEGAYFTDWTVNGVYAMGLASGVENVNCGADLLTLHFTVKEEAEPGEAAVTLINTEAYDVEETRVPFRIVAGTVTVRNSIPGDVTGDGIVNSLDLVRLKKYLVHIDVEIDESAADVTGDGIVNSLDLVRLKKYLVHMPVELL